MTATILNLENSIQRIGREIFERARRARPAPLTAPWWQKQGLAWTMRHEHLKDRLFRFIASMPGQPSSAAVAHSLREHLASNGDDLPWPLRIAVDFDDDRSWHARIVAAAARIAADRMARSFIVGSTPAEAVAAVRDMRPVDRAFTLDILGETVRAPAEADALFRRYLELIDHLSLAARAWPAHPLLDIASFGPLPRANVSVKLSALSTRFTHESPSPDPAESRARIAEIFRAARRLGVFINVDLEHVVLRDPTFEIFKDLLMQPEFRDWPDAGIVVQAYLRDSRGDLDGLVAFARRRGTPFTLRLVKGAYWDTETALAASRNRPSPLWAEKWESDASYEELTRVLVENADALHPAFGTHNVRSIAHALVAADAAGLPPRTIEIQMLFGMGDPLKTAVVEMQQRLRVYCPIGAWLPGVAYLVRRLAENTANESFLRQGFADGADESLLLSPPGQ